MKIYVASSWRNLRQPRIVDGLRQAGHEVYDFRNQGLSWDLIDTRWQAWTPSQFQEALTDPVAVVGFRSEYEAMCWADAFVLVMPCGRSAHLEAGWAVGRGKLTCILLDEGSEPELMYGLTHTATSVDEVVDLLGKAPALASTPRRGAPILGAPR